MPLVTVLDSPRGAPSATTPWPMRRFEEFPIEIVGRPDWPLTRSPDEGL